VAHLRASFVYSIKGLWVDDRILGSVIKCEREGYPVELRLPTRPDQFQEQTGLDTLAISDGVHWEGAEGRQFSIVNLVQVVVRGDLDLVPSDYDDMGIGGGGANKCHGFWAYTMGPANAVMSEFTEWARVMGQPWLGLRGETPQTAGRQVIYDEDRSIPLPLAWPWWSKGGCLIPEVVTMDRLETIKDLVIRGVEPDLAHSTMADAQTLVAGGANAARAVLTAAIAVEVRTKEVLRRAGVPPADKVVGVLLDNPRDWSLAAASLLDKPMEAVTGRSLRKEDKDLYKAAERLFSTRNGIAHRGEGARGSEPHHLVDAASRVIAWLDTILAETVPVRGASR
jgi:hypothetical protein